MNHYITGATIKMLREKQRMTQSQLAEKLCVSDKTISKWETGVSQTKGYQKQSMKYLLALKELQQNSIFFNMHFYIDLHVFSFLKENLKQTLYNT